MAQIQPDQMDSTSHVLTDKDYQGFNDFPYTQDPDFFTGVLYACGGPKKLDRTGSQAELILHTKIFYYKSKTGITIPAIGYKRWLRAQGFQKAQPNEWTILELVCNKRDVDFNKKFGIPIPQPTAKAQQEKNEWLHEIYQGELYDPAKQENQLKATGSSNPWQPQRDQQPAPSAPTWQTAAPKGELYVDRSTAPDDKENGKGQSGDAPYPVRFAQIIEAVQTGKPVDGIQEIPDIVARNADTRPFGNMTAPKKPWERAANGKAEGTSEPGYVVIEKDFPKPEDDASDAHD